MLLDSIFLASNISTFFAFFLALLPPVKSLKDVCQLLLSFWETPCGQHEVCH